MSSQRVIFTCLVIGHLLCSPRWFVALCDTHMDSKSDASGLQFSIKQLLVLTTAVAAVFGLRRGISETGHVEAVITVVGLCMLVVPLTAIWACLSAGKPLVPCVMPLIAGNLACHSDSEAIQ